MPFNNSMKLMLNVSAPTPPVAGNLRKKARPLILPLANNRGDWTQLVKNLQANIVEGLTASLSVELCKHSSSKNTDDRGIESLKVINMSNY